MIELVRPCLYALEWWNPDEDRPPGYYFWDEAGMESYGPYGTEEAAQRGLNEYELSLDRKDV